MIVIKRDAVVIAEKLVQRIGLQDYVYVAAHFYPSNDSEVGIQKITGRPEWEVRFQPKCQINKLFPIDKFVSTTSQQELPINNSAYIYISVDALTGKANLLPSDFHTHKLMLSEPVMKDFEAIKIAKSFLNSCCRMKSENYIHSQSADFISTYETGFLRFLAHWHVRLTLRAYPKTRLA